MLNIPAAIDRFVQHLSQWRPWVSAPELASNLLRRPFQLQLGNQPAGATDFKADRSGRSPPRLQAECRPARHPTACCRYRQPSTAGPASAVRTSLSDAECGLVAPRSQGLWRHAPSLKSKPGFQFVHMRVCSFFVPNRCLGPILMFSTKSASQRPNHGHLRDDQNRKSNGSGLRSAGTHDE